MSGLSFGVRVRGKILRKSHLQKVAAGTFFALTGLVLAGGYLLVDLVARPQAPAEAPPQRDTAGVPHSRVVVAVRPLPRGTVVAAADLGTLEIVGPLPQDMLANPGQAVGKTVRFDLLPGQAVVAGALAAERAGAGLAALVPEGMRAVTVRVTDEIAVGSHLRPGDVGDLHIVVADKALPKPQAAEATARTGDISEARILLQNVIVLAVGEALSAVQEGKPADDRRVEARDVTLAVMPEQATQLALVRSVASYYLSLRNGLDRATVPDRTIRVADIRGEDAGQVRVVPPNPKLAPARRTPSIEFINGAQKTTLHPGVGG